MKALVMAIVQSLVDKPDEVEILPEAAALTGTGCTVADESEEGEIAPVAEAEGSLPTPLPFLLDHGSESSGDMPAATSGEVESERPKPVSDGTHTLIIENFSFLSFSSVSFFLIFPCK